jgi:predicted glutamine amidotransferase
VCRWLAYSGSPVRLEELLYGTDNSLVVQSLHSRMGAEETNGDGFGVGWYGDRETPAVFRSVEPAWNDRNLREIAGHVTSGLVFAHIAPRPARRFSRRTATRSATDAGSGCTTG